MGSGDVLPDGPATLGHPANEDLFAGTPVRGGHFVGCVPFRGGSNPVGLPLVGVRYLPSDQREDRRSWSNREKVYMSRSDRAPRRRPLRQDKEVNT